MSEINAIRATYYKIAALASQINLNNDLLSEARMDELDRLFQEKAGNINAQAWNSLLFGLTGFSQALAPALGDTLGAVAKVAGKVLPRMGEVANTFKKSEETHIDAGMSKIRDHQKPAAEKADRQVTDAAAQFARALENLAQEDNRQYSSSVK